mgnify:CR=1 FL=1
MRIDRGHSEQEQNERREKHLHSGAGERRGGKSLLHGGRRGENLAQRGKVSIGSSVKSRGKSLVADDSGFVGGFSLLLLLAAGLVIQGLHLRLVAFVSLLLHPGGQLGLQKSQGFLVFQPFSHVG